MNRREALFSLGAAAASVGVARQAGAAELSDYPVQTALDPRMLPRSVRPGGAFQVLTDDTTCKTVTAVFDRLIPADELGPSASDAGCVTFLDAQLAGPYGKAEGSYREAPKQSGSDEIMQAPQFIATPRERYANGLKALNAYARAQDGADFSDLQPDRQDEILKGMESGDVSLGDGINTQAFFELMLANVREGYFADPIYGGNKDMVGWKLVGFPGARYDYRPYVDQIGKTLDLEPVSLIPRS